VYLLLMESSMTGRVARGDLFQLETETLRMIDHKLLDILVCPETKQPLRVADEGLLNRVNLSIDQGSVTNRGGVAVTAGLDEALVREDGGVLYPVRDDIPIMLIDESIPLPLQA
jgi:uncharacterized protein YbaR (Trm112 family)